MPSSDIVVRGAREHNLRDVDLVLPRNKLICLTGVSGSGKSSFAFDTVYAEGQRRYIESLSSFARQFLGQMPKPDVDFIAGLSPSISISQKSAGNNPRSTVGTITEIYDYLRVLFARVGTGHCPKCGNPITAQTREQILERIMGFETGTRFAVLAPLTRGQKGEFRDLFEDLVKQGFLRARVDGEIHQLSSDLRLDRQMRHDIELVIDRLKVGPSVRARLAEALELAEKMGDGTVIVSTETETDSSPKGTPAAPLDEEATDESAREDSEERGRGGRGRKRARKDRKLPGDHVFSTQYGCAECGVGYNPPSPQLFSFNSPQGMCLECDGLGELFTFDPALLIPDGSLSFKQGCIDTIGTWKDLGRWRRHIYQGVADTIERKQELPEGTLLETPWDDLDDELADVILYGTGEEHITFTWRGGNSPMKYGGKYEGVIPELLSKYRTSKSKMQIRKLENYMRTVPCTACHGRRLNDQAQGVKLLSTAEIHAANHADATHEGNGRPSHADDHRHDDVVALNLPQLCDLSIQEAADFFAEIVLDDTREIIAAELLKEIRARLGFLLNVGLDYLTLARTAPTLSGGESQRIRLAGQIGCGLVGVLYILDEPSIGLHPRDNDRLLATLQQLRDMGNTVLVVEHDEDTMREADHIIDFGPGPGVRGGEVVAEGPLEAVAAAKRSVTGKYLSGEEEISLPSQRRPVGDNRLRVVGARHNNLKHVDIEIPLGAFVCVTGVSGSGKSSLVNDILVEALRRDLNRGQGEPGEHDTLEGLDLLDKLIAIDQSPIGRTPRSNPGTYIKVFDEIRQLFAQMAEAKRRGYKPGRFSFNVDGGRCSACDGNGANKLEMDFLADIWVTCPVCQGHRYNRETLQVLFKGKSIADVLEMDVQQALKFFTNQPKIAHKLQTLHDVGLDYVKIGQPSPTLSGGEAQRIKLAKELVKKSTGQTLYLLDEPTTGLHFADIRMLLQVLQGFVDAGNTVLVVEHNLDIIKTADWIIDLGPEGGARGGEIVATGTPEQVAANPHSYTGRALAEVLKRHGVASANGKKLPSRKVRRKPHAAARAKLATKITVQGARQHNLKGVDLEIPRDETTVFCGMSGSGKTSLAMDTIYAEGQRRYVESLSSYARQFVSQMQKPQLDHIDGLSPAIAIEQKNLGHTPRSTVGTVTEIYDYFRVLFARLGTPYCPDCDVPVGTQTSDEIVDKILQEPEGTRMFLTAPLEIEVGQEYDKLWQQLRANGYQRVRIDGATCALDQVPAIDRRRKHAVEVVVDRISVRQESRSRLAEAVEAGLAIGKGVIHAVAADEGVPETRWNVRRHSQHLACDKCGRSFEPLSPHHFSFNSSLGWCPACEGLGTQTGANPAALIRGEHLSLREGALLLWPNIEHAVSHAMLDALSSEMGIPVDCPLDSLSPRQRRLLLHGTEDHWFSVYGESGTKKTNARPLFRFQFKGLYPALEEASRLSPSFRSKFEHLIDEVDCHICGGSRLRDDASAMRFRDRTVDYFCKMPLGDLQHTVAGWKFSRREQRIAGEINREIQNRVQFLNDVGLEYLSLSRSAPTLSAGESQRIRLASQLGSGLCGVLYVLDEPTIGLHPRDNRRLIQALHKLRDLGNTLIIVEHDREVIEAAQQVMDFGPTAGRGGGRIVARGTPEQLTKRRKSVTGPFLAGKKAIPVPTNRRIPQAAQLQAAQLQAEVSLSVASSTSPVGRAQHELSQPKLRIIGARHHNLKNVDVEIPLGTLTAVTGPSGSGKSSLIEDVLHAALARRLHRAATVPGAHDDIRGIEHINKVIRVDQQPIGNSPTSNPATYTGVFELIRTLFAQLPDAKVRGYTPRRFSFNVPGGRCEDCEGAGQRCIEMHFLPDVWVECDTCSGRRYNPETLAVKFHGQSIADVLEMSCGQALVLLQNIPKIRRILQTLCDVGLDYVRLGQAANTLSGGEAQRVKLAAELSRPDTGRTLYLLDEPTTGLHFEDLQKLLAVLHRLVDLGNTVVLIEHNLDVIKAADWVIDMGPEAGDRGGRVVTCGTPEQVAAYAASWHDRNGKPVPSNGKGNRTRKKSTTSQQAASDPAPVPEAEMLRSHTGEFLAEVLKAGPYERRPVYDPAEAEVTSDNDLDITAVGKDAKMPWEVDGRRWHTQDRVDRKGEPVKWDGRILGRVVDRIHDLAEFSDTDWSNRSVVEIAAAKKSEGWFFHAITAETFLLKMKFRTARGTVDRKKLQQQLELKTLNEMEELPVYGNEPRVKVRGVTGNFQEIEIRAHTLDEIDQPAFWEFLVTAVQGFQKFTERVAQKPEDLMPWKVMGQKWHFAKRGFPLGKPCEWEHELLEELYEILRETCEDGQFIWNNKQMVAVMAKGVRIPWAQFTTKRPQFVRLDLFGPKNAFGLGRVAELGCDRDVDGTADDYDQIQIKFRTVEDLHHGDLADFLTEHLCAVQTATVEA